MSDFVKRLLDNGFVNDDKKWLGGAWFGVNTMKPRLLLKNGNKTCLVCLHNKNHKTIEFRIGSNVVFSENNTPPSDDVVEWFISYQPLKPEYTIKRLYPSLPKHFTIGMPLSRVHLDGTFDEEYVYMPSDLNIYTNGSVSRDEVENNPSFFKKIKPKK